MQALLQQIAHLRQTFPPHRPTELQRWLNGVEQQLKAHQERVLRKPRPTGRPGAARVALDYSV
jgi:hypothetical protein